MASFLESLFGAFTGEPAMKAAQAARETLQDTFGQVIANNQAQRAESLGEIASGYQTGRNYAAPYFGEAGQNLANSGYNTIGLLGQYYAAPLQQTAGMQANALGLNGPGGTAAAQAAFQTGPGYQFQLQQGLDAINRSANAAGMGASGNMLREAQTFGQGLAAQEYNNWLKNLQTREGLYAPLAGRQADAVQEMGRNLANLDTTQANFYNQAFTDEVNRRAANRLGYTGLDVNAAGIFGPALASTDLAVGAAQQQAGANTVGLIGNVISGIGNIFRPGR
jgi:hypothetical protein